MDLVLIVTKKDQYQCKVARLKQARKITCINKGPHGTHFSHVTQKSNIRDRDSLIQVFTHSTPCLCNRFQPHPRLLTGVTSLQLSSKPRRPGAAFGSSAVGLDQSTNPVPAFSAARSQQPTLPAATDGKMSSEPIKRLLNSRDTTLPEAYRGRNWFRCKIKLEQQVLFDC